MGSTWEDIGTYLDAILANFEAKHSQLSLATRLIVVNVFLWFRKSSFHFAPLYSERCPVLCAEILEPGPMGQVGLLFAHGISLRAAHSVAAPVAC